MLLPPPARFHVHSTAVLGLRFSALLLLLPSCRHIRAPSFILEYNPDKFFLTNSVFHPGHCSVSSRCSSPPQPRHVRTPDSRHSQPKAALRHRPATGPLTGGSAAGPKSHLLGMGTRQLSPAAELGHRHHGEG